MSFSTGCGGTLALPSPTHAHHMDPTTVRNLRRSMSRSPTKLITRASSHGLASSRQGSPKSPNRRLATTPLQQRPVLHAISSTPPAVDSSTVASAPQLSPAQTQTPLRPGVKLSLRSAKGPKAAPPSRITRARVSPRSPLKRALSTTPDSGNSTSSQSPISPLRARFAGQENNSSTTPEHSAPRKAIDRARSIVQFDITGASQLAFLKTLEEAGDPSMTPTTGALKRSDATMNLDQSNQGSPVAKRRSLHGILNSVQSQDLFNPSASQLGVFDIHEDSFPEYELSSTGGAISERHHPASPTHASNIPKRSSSLRRSTLQQRYGEKTSWGRRSGERQSLPLGADLSTLVRHRPRLSADSFVPPTAGRENPFAAGTSAAAENKSHQPHPLSKTLTTSTSGNSLTEEQSFYAPAKVVAASKPHPFSRSLPPGAMRPSSRHAAEQRTMATPNQSHQLWIGAFNSTGLVSKVNRNLEDEADKKMAPPDTPCKKHINPFATFPPPGSSGKKRGNSRKSFGGIPSTPFGPIMGRAPDTVANPGKGLSIFQRSSVLGNRRGSILGADGEDAKLFADGVDFAASAEGGDIPPTPTKNLLTPSFSGLSNFSESSQESPSANRTLTLSLSAVKAPPPPPPQSRESTCKSILDMSESLGDKIEEAHSQADRSTPSNRGPTPTDPLSLSSFGRARTRRGLSAPQPLTTELSTLTHSSRAPPKLSKNVLTKMMCVESVSPDGRRTPQTPQENLLPLDTSRLSISQTRESRRETHMPPPVTPTNFRSSTSIFVTPVNNARNNTSLDIDASLYSKFDKVEQIGKGEFSTVYRVTKQDFETSFTPASFTPVDSHARKSSANTQVFAVKKTKQPYHGPKDREAKLREARILRALSHAEHVVQYIDDWEHDFHLYIQTEFCEEGTLDKFLAHVGQLGRLDDFRIYKILQDLCLGLKEIHDAGFMHLDMKPANILITFEGVIKIGDFGLAQAVSDDIYLDIEGDREYMAPEMLEGKTDQSADIFSLGLMTLEAAANVMLPDNGPTWVALRSGDLSEVPSLTWTPSSEVQRDALGNPTESAMSDELHEAEKRPRSPGNLFGSFKRSELQQPPEFMVEAFHPSSLDSIVRWMTQQEPEERPRIEEVLALEGLQWVAEHRNAPAIVYEGNWGPSELFPVSIINDSDLEMTDI